MDEMTGDSDLSRRKFLTATGGTAAAVTVAGCGGNGNGGSEETATDDDMEETATDSSESYSPPNSYPYSANETDVESAKQVMEEAGYSPDNRYELDWLQYNSDTWEEMASTIRSRLKSAHIDMNISKADFGPLLEQTGNGNHEAYTLGWIADYPAPQNFLQLIDPENTVYDAEDFTPNGARLFWSEDAQAPTEIRNYITEQFGRIQDNPQNTDEAQQARDDATPKIEAAMWDAAGLLPVYHRVDELFWYDRVDYDPPGAMGSSRAKAINSVQGLEGSDTLNGVSATFSEMDPIASGNTASGGKVMNMFDAPMNYQNGTTEVEPLIVEDFSVSDDVTEYEFTLKEGIQFHDDYGEVTASDVVYSIRRLVESSNSTNTSFPISVLNIEREEDDDGNVVPGSTGVEETGEYTFTVTLRDPFGYALSVIAYSAFSVVPEGIVGDIEGYEGDMSWEEFSQNPVGCGPFVFESFQSGAGGQFNASAFEDYHGESSAVGAISDAIIEDPSAQYNYFLNENADVSGIPTSKYDPSKVNITEEEGGQGIGTYGELDNGKTVNMSQTPSINTFYIGFNMEEVPTPVRRAMAYVINRQQFVDNVFKGRGAGAFNLTPTQIFPGGAQEYRQNWQGE